MTIAFPAYHTERREEIGDEELFRRAAKRAIRALGWTFHDETDWLISGNTGISIWSWGEKFTIRFLRKGGVEVTSKCSFPTQCFDWGKNRKNVEKFFRELSIEMKELSRPRVDEE